MKGVLTIAIGKRYCRMAKSLIRSLRLFNPGTPVAVVTDLPKYFSGESAVQVIQPRVDLGSGIKHKLYLDEYSPFESTLCLDSDCLVFGSLEKIWRDCQNKDFGVYGVDGVNPKDWWYFAGVPETRLRDWGGITQFNGGLYFFRRGEVANKVFATVRNLAESYSDFGLGGFRGGIADEPLFAIAMAGVGLRSMREAEGRFALPTEFGFATGFGDVYKGVFGYVKNGKKCTATVAHFFGEWATCFFYRRELFRLLVSPRGGCFGLTGAVTRMAGDFCYLAFLWLRAMALKFLRPCGPRLAPGLVLIPATSFFSRKRGIS